MPNRALAPLDTVTEPAIAVEGRDRCEWLVSAAPTVRRRRLECSRATCLSIIGRVSVPPVDLSIERL
jgi:hypothetical protein